ncbi:MAG: hypothetical protein LBC63_11110 [Holophagales bacterium]|nr:hypothetical protein [Holophagales bacterium]
MVFRSRTFLGIILALALVGPARSQSPPTMPVSEIRTGMKGYGLTVFKGGAIERFEFEVLGIEKNHSPGRNRILFKAAGGPLANTGIMAGMSGSPCYIDGKLVGALSVGFPWAKEPIGGITPIHEMLDQLMDVPDAISARTPLMPPRLDPSKIVRSAQLGEMVPLADILGLPKKTEADNAMTGQSLPVMLQGASLAPEARACWDGLPVQFIGAVATAGGAADPSPIEPGGMVAVTLVQGDMMLAATGTITYVSDKRILLFGHNLMGNDMGTFGAIDLPLWSASVTTPLASYSNSVKLSQPVAPIGAIRLDRPTGVAGVFGAEPRMIPFRIGLNLGGKRNMNFSFDVIDHPALTPLLVHTVLVQTIAAHVRETGMQSLSLQGNIKIANQQPLMVENMSADLSSSRLPMYFASMVQAIYFNSFERPVIEGLSVNIKGEERLDLTAIAGVRPLVARAKRGQSLPLLITLQNIQGVRETATLSVQVPLSAKPGKAILKVGDGLSMLRDDSDTQRIRTTSLAEHVLLLNGTLKNNYAYAFLTQEFDGAGLRGNRIEGIPPSISSLLMSDGDTSDNRLQRRVIGRAVLPLEREVSGLFTLELEIE